MLEYAVLNHLADGEVLREQSLRSATGASREIFRTMLATLPSPGQGISGHDDLGAGDLERVAAFGPRLQQIAIMLDRATARGEAAPPLMDVIDHLLAPLYMRTLFGAPISAAFAHDLADRLTAPPRA